MNSVAIDIMDLLDANSLGVKGVDLFALEWGFDANGEIDQQTLVLENENIQTNDKDIYEQPTFQVLVRGKKNESGKTVYDRARVIFEFIIQQKAVTVNGTEYLHFEPLNGVSLIGRDDNDRFVATMNFYTFRNSY